jgi:hypothetical protein
MWFARSGFLSARQSRAFLYQLSHGMSSQREATNIVLLVKDTKAILIKVCGPQGDRTHPHG